MDTAASIGIIEDYEVTSSPTISIFGPAHPISWSSFMDSVRLAGSIEFETRNHLRVSNPSVIESQADLSEQNRRNRHNVGVEQQLAPADGGAAAWKVLCAAFTFEAVLWGQHKAVCAYGRRY